MNIKELKRIIKDAVREVIKELFPDNGKPEKPAPEQPAMAAKSKSDKKEIWDFIVHKEEAEKDSRKPEDFLFDHLKVSKVEIVPDTKFGIKYLCRMPSDTPIPNRYDDEGNKIPDPVGMALAWVQFSLVDSATRSRLDTQSALPTDRLVTGYPPLKGETLWNTLAEQTSAPLKVVLEATPVFFFLSEDGSAMLNYFLTPDGYARGKTVKSKVYNLSMNENGEVTLTPHYT